MAATTDELKISKIVQGAIAETAEALQAAFGGTSDRELRSWINARRIITEFPAVPWFVWRISNLAFSRKSSAGGSSDQSDKLASIPEGMVLGLKRIIMIAAQDQTFLVAPSQGASNLEAPKSLNEALRRLGPDATAAVAVIHALVRKLNSQQSKSIVQSGIDDLLARVQLGALIGARAPEAIGIARGALVGCFSIAGHLAALFSSTPEQTTAYLELLTTGKDEREACIEALQVDPLHVSSLLLSAAGCSRGAAFGFAAYTRNLPVAAVAARDLEQATWMAALTVFTAVREKTTEKQGRDAWEILGLDPEVHEKELLEINKKIVRRGHSLTWLASGPQT